jgi:hypothetical protein
MTLAAFLIINGIFFMPTVGLLATPWMLITCFIAVPLVYLALTLLVHIIGLVNKPLNANVIAQIFLPVVLTLMINLILRNVVNAGSWLFTVIHLGLAVAGGILVLVLRSKLEVERIILSR